MQTCCCSLHKSSQQILLSGLKDLSLVQLYEQFRKIVLKATTDGALVHLSDVARVELGTDNYGIGLC